MDIEKVWKEKKKIIDKAIDFFLPSEREEPKRLHKAMRYYIFPGGKRIRPFLLLLSNYICKGDEKKAIPAACAVELLHNFSLIQDDIPSMDNDDFRRQKPSCHRKFGEATAILASDGLLISAFSLLNQINNPQIIKEVTYFIGSKGMLEGQFLDLYHLKDLRKKGKINGALLQKIRAKKTGYLFSLSSKLGAILANASEEKIKVLSQFGLDFGLYFQIIDDIRDKENIEEKETSLRKIRRLRKKMDKEISLLGERSNVLKDLIKIATPLRARNDKQYFDFTGAPVTGALR